MTIGILQRQERRGESYTAGDLLRLETDRAGEQLDAACRPPTRHLVGTLRLEPAASPQPWHLCPTLGEVPDTSEARSSATVEKGWA